MKYRFIKKDNGFTFIELLIYVAIFSIIIGVIISFIFWLVQSNIKAKVVRETMDNAERIMRTVTKEIKEAKSIYSPTFIATQLSLETAKYLPEGESMSYIDFYLCESRFCFKKESQDPSYLTSDNVEIVNLVFTQIGISSIKIDLTVDYIDIGGKPEYQSSTSLSSTISLRSY